jgi:hypothetical protein
MLAIPDAQTFRFNVGDLTQCHAYGKLAGPSLTRISGPDKLFELADAATEPCMFVLQRIVRSAFHWVRQSRMGQ